MPKKINPNKKEHGIAKSRQVYDWIDNARLQELLPERDSWRKRLIYSIYEWAETSQQLTASNFCITYRIPRMTFMGWVNKYDDVKAAFEMAKIIIADRRVNGALYRQMDKEVAFKDLYRYDSEWDEIDKRNAALRKSETPDAVPTIVQLPAAPDTGIQSMHKRKEEHAASQD